MQNFDQKSLKELKKMSAMEYDAYLNDMQRFIKERKKENASQLKIEKEKRENAKNKEFYLSIKKIFEKANIKATPREMIRTFENYFKYDNNLKYLIKVHEGVNNERH